MAETKIPYLDLKSQYAGIRHEVLAAFEEICESTRFAQGPAALQFEREFAAFCGVRHCVSCNSGTSALHLAMHCLDIGSGDEVITTPFTFIATAWAISYVGARPVFVDIDPARRTLDPKLIEKAITPKTKAIVPVHLFGMPAEMDVILEISARHGIPVVEDAAQAHGAKFKGRTAGQMGVMTAFSFYPGKNLGAYGEGGALVMQDDALAARSRSLREHGQAERYHHREVGYNYRMDSFQGAVLSIKLKHLARWNEARRRCASWYQARLKGTHVKPPAEFADSECVWHCFVVETDNRDEVRKRLLEAGIETGVHYPVPLHLQQAYAGLGYKAGDFPVTEYLAGRCISLPIYPELTEAQVDYVCEHLLKR